MKCGHCGSERTKQMPGKGPHWAALRCADCNRHIKWLANPEPEGNGMALKKICGLWANKDKNGKSYISGKLPDGKRVMIFRDHKKAEGTKAPDYILYEATDDKNQEANRDA